MISMHLQQITHLNDQIDLTLEKASMFLDIVEQDSTSIEVTV